MVYLIVGIVVTVLGYVIFRKLRGWQDNNTGHFT